MTPCCPNISALHGYGLRGGTIQIPAKNRFSGLTRAEIETQCAASYIPSPPLQITSADRAAYDSCVAQKLQERTEGRIQTYMNIGDWFACTFLGKCKDQLPAPTKGTGAQQAGMGGAIMWVGLFILLAILAMVGFMAFRKK